MEQDFVVERKAVMGVRETPTLRVLGGGASDSSHSPEFIRNFELSKEERRRLRNEMMLSTEHFQVVNERPMRNDEKLLLAQEMLYRKRFGASPYDVMTGEIQGVGQNRGKKITGGKFELSVNRQSGLAEPSGLFTLADSGSTTQQGNQAGDLAPVWSPWDTGLHGGSAFTVPPPYLNTMLRVYARKTVFLPLAFVGFAPALTFKQRVRTNSVYDYLFQGTNLATLKSGVKPREERASASIHIRPKFGEVDYTCRGYMADSYLTWELLTSPGEGILGIEDETINDLYSIPSILMDYDIFQAIWTGTEYGKQRRYSADTNDWDLSTFEVPFGAANFITSNAYKHSMFVDSSAGPGKWKLFKPSADANYRKYQSSVAVDDLWSPDQNGPWDILAYQAVQQRKKGMNLDVSFMSAEMAAAIARDERTQNMWYTTGDLLKLDGSAGLSGYVSIPGVRSRIGIFTYDEGGVPPLTDGGTPAVTIDHYIISGEAGKGVLVAPFWPVTLIADREYESVSIDSKTVTRNTLNNVLTIFSMECVEAMDLRALTTCKVIKTPHS